MDPPSGPAGGLDTTLKHLHEQRACVPTDDPNVVRRGVFKYDRQQEEERMRLAEDLVRRVDPGPYEDPNYLALLAYQAASLEMSLRFLAQDRENERWSRFLLGTAHSSEVNAFAQTLRANSHVVVVLYSALVDFVYQAAKALTAAQNPAVSSSPGSTVSSTTGVDDIEAALQANPEPVERLYRTLEAYFYGGYPRAFANEPVKPEQAPSLSTLVGLAERWAIAHEYGHGLAAYVSRQTPPGVNREWAEEFFADQNATILSVVSADRLDGMPPEFPLASGVFVLACFDVLRRALSVVRDGEEPRTDPGGGHPPDKLRAQNVVDTFHRFFDARYDGPHLLELRLVLRRQAPAAVPASTRRQIRHAFDFANGLLALWKPVRTSLLRDHTKGRRLHPMWTQ